MQMIQLSRIGKCQMVDVERSGNEIHDEYFRTCTVLQGNPPISDIGDTIPFHMAKLYGGAWDNWNRHFVVQVAGCPFKCWYCYVDNLEADIELSVREIVDKFVEFRSRVPNLNVFHFMGGCPGRYSYLWPEIRRTLNAKGLEKTVFLSDVILAENWKYGRKPWEDIPSRSIISVCLKGTNFHNFKANTGVDGFAEAIHELFFYFGSPQVHFSVIEWDPMDKANVATLLGGEEKADWMKVKLYHTVRERLERWRRP